MTRLTLGAVLGYAVARPVPLVAAAQLGILPALAHRCGRIVGLGLDRLIGPDLSDL